MRKMCQSQQFVTWDRGFCHIEGCITFCRRCSSAAFEKIAAIYRRCLYIVGTLAPVPSLPIAHILLSASGPALSNLWLPLVYVHKSGFDRIALLTRKRGKFGNDKAEWDFVVDPVDDF